MAQFASARHLDLLAGAPFAFFGPQTPIGTPQFSPVTAKFRRANGWWDVLSGAPFVNFSGTPGNLSQRPNPIQAVGQQQPDSAPAFAFFKGTPAFTPPPPRNLGYFSFAPQWDGSQAPFVTFSGTPAFVPPAPRGPFGNALGVQQDPGVWKPYSFTQNTVPQAITTRTSRGSGVFVSPEIGFNPASPYTFTRSTLAIPTPGTTGIPAFRASFNRANGWWDILAEAPFFFAAGFSTQPPRGPFGSAIARVHTDASAPDVFVAGYAAVSITANPPFGSSVTTKQLDTGDAPYTFFRSMFPVANPKPPVGGLLFTRPLEDSAAAFTFLRSRYIATPFPPFGGGVFARVHTDAAAPDTFIAGFAAVSQTPQPPFGSTILTRQHDDASAAFTFLRTVYKLTQAKPLPGVFVPQQVDAAAAFTFFRDRTIVVVPAITPVASRGVFAPQLPDASASFTFARLGANALTIIIPTRPPPVGFPIAEVQLSPDAYLPPRVLAFFNPSISQPMFQGLLVQQAIFNLVNAGLEVFITYGYSTTVPFGYVISQDPPAGTPLPPFSVVTIVASEGLPPAPGVLNTTVPTLNGLTAHHARDLIFRAGLSLNQSQWVVSAQTAGTVVSQSPIALSSVPYGTLVTLTLSLGPTKVIPPIISPP